MFSIPLGLLSTDVQKPNLPTPEPKPRLKLPLDQVLPFLGYLTSRIFAALVTFIIVTAVVYASTLLVPADDRARLYVPEKHRYEEAGAIRQYP